jgi:hypothetical protein
MIKKKKEGSRKKELNFSNLKKTKNSTSINFLYPIKNGNQCKKKNSKSPQKNSPTGVACVRQKYFECIKKTAPNLILKKIMA